MKKSGYFRRILAIFALVAVVMVVVGGIQILIVRGHNAIFDALAAHDNARVIALINSGTDPNSTLFYPIRGLTNSSFFGYVLGYTDPKNGSGYTILGRACSDSNVEVCKALLDKGADPNLTPKEGSSPLSNAITGDSSRGTADIVKVVNLLLQHHADVNASDGDATPPLALAVRRRLGDVVNILLRHGAKINYQDKGGYTSLYYAAARGNTDIVTILLTAGADPTIASSTGVLPIDGAVNRGHKKIGAILKDAMAKRKAVKSNDTR
ncbi:MAG: ankyrin repeat domain-containing protein [Chthonomonadales bacterium]